MERLIDFGPIIGFISSIIVFCIFCGLIFSIIVFCISCGMFLRLGRIEIILKKMAIHQGAIEKEVPPNALYA